MENPDEDGAIMRPDHMKKKKKVVHPMDQQELVLIKLVQAK
jgi:hypothetical protein